MILNLKEDNSNLSLHDLRYINMISENSIYQFVIESLSRYGNKTKLLKANKVLDNFIAKLKKKKQIKEGEIFQIWIQVMIAAALLHNLFYNGTLHSIFLAREKLTSIAKECMVPENGAGAIFVAIEAQLGDDMPIDGCRPVPGTPNELLVWSIWEVTENITRPKKMPNL